MSEESRREGNNPDKVKAGRKNVEASPKPSPAGHPSRTAGESDYDETGESKNQGHGHPREERASDQPG